MVLRFPTLRTVAAVVCIGAAGVFAWSVATTAEGRVSATTENTSSLFATGVVDVNVQVSDAARLLFDADGLYPGMELESCVLVTYEGSIPARLRLSGERSGGTGLDRYLETTITVGTADTADCDGFTAERRVFAGTLDELLQRHQGFTDGLPIGSSLQTGDQLALRVTATLIDDNAAQGLTSEFWVTLEARP